MAIIYLNKKTCTTFDELKFNIWAKNDRKIFFHIAVDVNTCVRELHPSLHTAISALSGGPVGPGDRIGGEDVGLLRKLARADGMLLKPDRPSMAINSQMIRAAFGDSDPTVGPKGEVWSTLVNYENQQLAFGKYFFIINSQLPVASAGLTQLITQLPFFWDGGNTST